MIVPDFVVSSDYYRMLIDLVFVSLVVGLVVACWAIGVAIDRLFYRWKLMRRRKR